MYCLHPSIQCTTLTGSDVTVIGYGAQIQPLRQACIVAKEQLGVSCELIDLRTIVPWDEDTVIKVSALFFITDNSRSYLFCSLYAKLVAWL